MAQIITQTDGKRRGGKGDPVALKIPNSRLKIRSPYINREQHSFILTDEGRYVLGRFYLSP
jgi:hypothetical protein